MEHRKRKTILTGAAAAVVTGESGSRVREGWLLQTIVGVMGHNAC